MPRAHGAAWVLLLLAGMCAAQTMTRQVHRSPTGESVQFLGDSVSLKYFPAASANCSQCYLAFKIGALSELDAFGQPVASHTIPDMSLLVPEVTGGQRVSGAVSYNYLTMTFPASRLPPGLTKNNCPSLESIINRAYAAGVAPHDNELMTTLADQANVQKGPTNLLGSAAVTDLAQMSPFGRKLTRVEDWPFKLAIERLPPSPARSAQSPAPQKAAVTVPSASPSVGPSPSSPAELPPAAASAPPSAPAAAVVASPQPDATGSTSPVASPKSPPQPAEVPTASTQPPPPTAVAGSKQPSADDKSPAVKADQPAAPAIATPTAAATPGPAPTPAPAAAAAAPPPAEAKPEAQSPAATVTKPAEAKPEAQSPADEAKAAAPVAASDNAPPANQATVPAAAGANTQPDSSSSDNVQPSQPVAAVPMQPAANVAPPAYQGTQQAAAADLWHQQLAANNGYLPNPVASAEQAWGAFPGTVAAGQVPYGAGNYAMMYPTDPPPQIKITFMFGFSHNKTFAYGQGRVVSAPAGSIKYTIEAQNWPFCSLYNSLKLEVVMASTIKEAQPQFVLSDANDLFEDMDSMRGPATRKLHQSEAFTDFMDPEKFMVKKGAAGVGVPGGLDVLGMKSGPVKSVSTAKLLVGPNLAAATEFPTYAFSSDRFTSESNVSVALATGSAARFSLTFRYFEQGLFYDPTVFFTHKDDMMLSGSNLIPNAPATSLMCNKNETDCFRGRRRQTPQGNSSSMPQHLWCLHALIGAAAVLFLLLGL